MNVQQLFDIAEQSDIYVDTDMQMVVPSVSCDIGDLRHIGFRKGLNNREMLVCFAHELGHHKRGAFYQIEAPCFTRGQCEYKADKWAVHKLIPIRSLYAAFKKGCTEAWQLAEYFDVTEEFVQKTIEIYKQEGKLPA